MGHQQIGNDVFNLDMAKQLCDSLCDNATLTLGGCTVASGKYTTIKILLEHESCKGKIKSITACPFENKGFPEEWSTGDCSVPLSQSTSCFDAAETMRMPDGTRPNKPAWITHTPDEWLEYLR
jgi:Fe-S-cluster-containing dehydrogenase component